MAASASRVAIASRLGAGPVPHAHRRDLGAVDVGEDGPRRRSAIGASATAGHDPLALPAINDVRGASAADPAAPTGMTATVPGGESPDLDGHPGGRAEHLGIAQDTVRSAEGGRVPLIDAMAYRYLWSPLELGPVEVRNRIVFSAHLTNYARNGAADRSARGVLRRPRAQAAPG